MNRDTEKRSRPFQHGVVVWAMAILIPAIWAPAGFADCIGGDLVPDMPACACFISTPQWPPPGTGDVPRTAERTLGTITSCMQNRGQPYWQMQLFYLDDIAAHHGAHFDADFINDKPAQAWCTETIAYWHWMARLPYNDGYYSNWWWSKFVTNTRDLREWYQFEETLPVFPLGPGRGHWIDGTELDYENFEPGVNGPCPGAYQQLEGLDAGGDWVGSSVAHSQLVDSMILWRDGDGKVSQIDLLMIDGNAGAGSGPDVFGATVTWANVRKTWYRDIVQYTTLGTESIGSYKIRGWGIDEDGAGNPIVDDTRIIEIGGPYFPHLIVPQPAQNPDSTDSVKIVRVIQYFAAATGGVLVTANSPSVQTGGQLPKATTNSWIIPAGSHPVDPVTIDVDLRTDFYEPIQGVTFEWKDGWIPPVWEVWWSPSQVMISTKTITAATPLVAPPPGIGPVPYHVGFSATGGMTVRYVRLRIPFSSLTRQYEIVGLHLIPPEFPGEDDDSSFAGPPECDCGKTRDPHADVTRDGQYDVLDVTATVGIAFRGTDPGPRDRTCPVDRADTNCDTVIDVLDVVNEVAVAFRGADAATTFCDPCL